MLSRRIRVWFKFITVFGSVLWLCLSLTVSSRPSSRRSGVHDEFVITSPPRADVTTPAAQQIPRRLAYLYRSFRCPPTADAQPPREQDWQSVDNVTHVYSAYVDPRNVTFSVVRVIALALYRDVYADKQRIFYCQFHMKEGYRHVVPARIRTYGPRRETMYKGVSFDCIVRVDPWLNLHMLVSIATSRCGHPNNTISVQQPYLHAKKRDFAVCLSGVLKHNISSYQTLIEWVELNTILGGEHFFVYNFTAGSQLKPVLDYYKRKGVLTETAFSLPIPMTVTGGRSHKDFATLWNYGQEIVIQDCLQRNQLVSKYVVYEDIDEFIIPRSHGDHTWHEMIRNSNCTNEAGVFAARNANFPLQMTYEAIHDAKKFHIKSILHKYRQPQIYPAFKHTKYIAMTEKILFGQIHHKDTYWTDGTVTCVLPLEVGFLHHYRHIYKKNLIPDHSMDKYAMTLLHKVKRVYHEMGLV